MKSTHAVPLLKSAAGLAKLPFGTCLNYLRIHRGHICYSGRHIPNERPIRSECFWGWIVTKPKDITFPEHRDHRQYRLPFAEGTKVDDLEIKMIGFEESCINWFDCMVALVPVRFTDDSFGIICVSFYGSESFHLLKFDGDAADAVRNSKTMPYVQRGLGSGVTHIQVSDQNGFVLVKTFSNDKAGRRDEVHR